VEEDTTDEEIEELVRKEANSFTEWAYETEEDV